MTHRVVFLWELGKQGLAEGQGCSMELGRQGDVGSSQFFVSLEDNLMRLFGSRLSKFH